MWTIELLERLASGFVQKKTWHSCERCRTEYQSLRLAWNCFKGHFRSYEREYAAIDTEVVKHEVVFVGGQPLCGNCASKVKEDAVLCVVRMAEPPICIRCDGEIRDKPLAEVKPGRLPHSERHHDLILRPSREAEEVVMQHSWHKKIRKAGLNSIASPEINAKLFKEFGPYQQDGNGGLVRTETGYLEVAQKGMVEACLPKC